jgi:hypothetical protein
MIPHSLLIETLGHFGAWVDSLNLKMQKIMATSQTSLPTLFPKRFDVE